MIHRPPRKPPLLPVEIDAQRLNPGRAVELAELTGNRALRGAALGVLQDRRAKYNRSTKR